MDAILVANAGSSSFKFQVFATDGVKELLRVVKGQIDGIGMRPYARPGDGCYIRVERGPERCIGGG
jgi:acetate kinase